MMDKTKTLTGAEDVIWDLTDLYQGVNDPNLEEDLNKANALAQSLADEYKGRVADIDAEEMRDFIERYEEVYELFAGAAMFAYLDWSVNTSDPQLGALRQKIAERGAKLQQTLVFWELEWANTPEEKAAELMQDAVLQDYYHWLEVARLNQPYLLTEPEEKIMSEKQVTGSAAWNRYFEQFLASQRYELDGEKVPFEAISTVAVFDPDRSRRQQAMESISEVLREEGAFTSTFVFNTLLADKFANDRLRNYPTWISSRNLANEVDDDAVQALVDAVTGRYDIVHRYYKIKGKVLGIDTMHEWDRYAPLPSADTFYSWEQAQEIVLNAFKAFDSRVADAARDFFEQNWIHAPVLEGKSGGAYCYSVGGDKHPYVMVNYKGKSGDVMTLAHELGHGMHGMFSMPKGVLQSNTPLTTAETASVFAEMLVFQDLLSREDDPEVQLAMLMAKIESEMSTIFRQTAMNRFEDAIHTHRREQGELTTEQFNEYWIQTQQDMFGDSLEITDDYGIWWSYVTHFTRVPGYVYAYAFGNLLVLALYARYQEVGGDFASRYIDMLAAGGSEWPHKLVEPLGIDLTDSTFWHQGLDILEEMVSQAEELAASVM